MYLEFVVVVAIYNIPILFFNCLYACWLCCKFSQKIGPIVFPSHYAFFLSHFTNVIFILHVVVETISVILNPLKKKHLLKTFPKIFWY
jgi:hypothetical protein